jgi:hypothetical protein
MPEKLNADQIAMIMASGRQTKKADPTEPRNATTWFRLNHRILEEGCQNPDCADPRNKDSDRATNIVAEVKGKLICRYCFLDGYLSDKHE